MRAGGEVQRESWEQVYPHSINEFSGSGLKHWSFFFKFAITHDYSDNCRILSATETRAREVSPEQVQIVIGMDGETLTRMSSNIYNCPQPRILSRPGPTRPV